MSRELKDDLEKILGTMARLYGDEGLAREVAILALSKPRIEQTGYDNWDGGQDGFTIYLEVPITLYHQLGQDVEKIEIAFKDRADQVTRLYQNQCVQAFILTTELTTDEDWREKAKAFLMGKGLTNQGRARSDNVAPRVCDGLLFRSQPEIHLYRAFKALGITFAPLPVFIRGGETYRRIEPDFVLFKDGILMHVEVDGDTVHRETPVEAHDRTTMLLHEGAHVERVNAKDCATPEKAKECAARLLEILKKLKANR
jgi:hypothetical protein